MQSSFCLAVCPEKWLLLGGDSGCWETISQLAHVAPAWGDQLSCSAEAFLWTQNLQC